VLTCFVEIRNVKLAGTSYQQGPYFQQEGVMKTSVGFAASLNSAVFVAPTIRLVRVFPKLLIALIAILLAGALPSSARGGQADSNWEPEIVRLSYVQGDVRLSRGGKNGADLNTAWEVAKTNTPVEEGFTVATGAGRAEIEFQNGTILYLADNSVLEFNRLEDTADVPITELELVTGTATANVKPAPSEFFTITTPSERLTFPMVGLVRVDSFLNAATATPENEAASYALEYWHRGESPATGPLVLYIKGERFEINLSADELKSVASELAKIRAGRVYLNSGQSITYQNGARKTGVANDSGAPADWDSWVLARVTKRDQEMTAALKASGLSASVPGLIDMYESGIFYPCGPDGQCWKPNGVDGSDGVIDIGDGAVMPDGTGVASDVETDAGLIASLRPSIFPAMNLLTLQSPQFSQQSQSAQPGTAQQPAPGTVAPGGPQKPKVTIYRVRLDECSDEVRRQEVTIDPVTHKRIVLRETIEHDPWMWGVCNSGGWIPYRNHYRFVAGEPHHHRVHYVHIGKKICWVPRHPHDKRGQTPLNLKNGAFAARKKPGAPLQFVKWNPSDKVKLLTTKPRQFRSPTAGRPTGTPAQRPDIHARLATRGPVNVARTQPTGKVGPVAVTKPTERTISYNYHSHSFERPSGTPVSGHTSAKPEVVGHFTANGQFNSGSTGGSRGSGGGPTTGGRTSGGGGNGGYSGGGHSSGGSSGGGYSGGGHSGGGSSGGSSGGGGGGHSSGGSSGGGSSGGGGGGGHSGGGGSSGGGGGAVGGGGVGGGGTGGRGH
jgi:hypothetical protein